jgi:phosphatidylserine decarboxylase
MLTRYGTDNIIIMLLLGAVLIAGGVFTGNPIVKILLWSAGALLILFTFWFFRDPDRDIPDDAPNNPAAVISPADGKVMEIVEMREDIYMKSRAIRISIFLSPLDVHVNRVPASGIIEYYDYSPGKFFAAYESKASEMNEQSRIGLKTEAGRIFFKQIVGVLARRLVCELKVGDTVQIGEKFGMMKFGSRMDVFLPADSELKVKVNEKVVAGESILGMIK